MPRPLLALALALAAGALVGDGVPPVGAALLLGLAVPLLACALATGSRLAGAALLAGAFAIGAAAAGAERSSYDGNRLRRWVEDQAPVAEPVLLRGVAAVDAREREDRWTLTLDVETVTAEGREDPLPGRVRVDVFGQAGRTAIQEGDRVRVWALLRPPRGFGNPGSFDAAAQARREGIHALGHCKSPWLVTPAPGVGAGVLRRAAARARQWARARLLQSVLPGPEQGLVRAMVLGDRTGIDAETAELFRAAGTYHVLAISGAQVALLAGVLTWLVRRLGLAPAATALAVSAVLVFYAEFVGGDVPVARAAVMAIVLLAGRALDLEADLANLLGLAGGVLLVHRPSAVGDVGFQLSFLATLGILLLTPVLLKRRTVVPLRLDLALAASLAAQAALAPLLIIHFHRLAPAALLLNLAAVPLSGAVLLTGLGVLAAAALGPSLAAVVGDLAWVSAHCLLRSSDLVDVLPALDLRFPDPPWLGVGTYVTGLVLLARTGRPRRGLTLSGVGLAALFMGGLAPARDGRLHLTVLDVGQGDCLVLRSPRGRVWLVDAGGSHDGDFDPGAAVVAPYLWSTGVRRLDKVVITHAHPDHVGGLPFLLRSFRVGEVWEGLAPVSDPVYARLDGALRAAHVGRMAVGRGVRQDWDGVSVDVLWPRPGPRPPWKTRNDDSIVLALEFGSVRMLLTGDVEREAEEKLDSRRAAVLKVPHHGSRSSSTARLVAAVSPRVAVVSAGHRNRFGHPHPDVVKRYLQVGARVYRTDRDGAVTVSSDGERLWVRTFREGREEPIR